MRRERPNPVPSLFLIAKAELRTRWASLLLIGVLAGLTGGTIVTAVALAQRTATADERLRSASNADDVRVQLFGGSREATRALGEIAIGRPEVADARIVAAAISRLNGPGVTYRSVMIEPERWGTDVLSPVLSAGRLPDPERPGEVVVNEAILTDGPSELLDQSLTLHFLAAEEFTSFDAGTPLEGEAGTETVTVVGAVRYPGSPEELPPFIGTPALAAAHPDAFGYFGAAVVRLRPDADPATYLDAITESGSDVVRDPAFADMFAPFLVTGTAAQSIATTRTTTSVLTTGLLILAAVAALVGGAAVVQAALRHHAAGRPAQRVESAVGMTRGERAGARLLAAVPAVAAAFALTIGTGLATGSLEPPGILSIVEPHPGWAPNLPVIAATGALVALVLVVTLVVSAAREIATDKRQTHRESRLVARIAGLGGRPPTVLGLRFALGRSTGTSGVSGRAAIATIGTGLAGLVAVSVYTAGLDRLVASPVRFGYPAELSIADADADVAAALQGERKFETVIAGQTAEVIVDGASTSGTSMEALEGTLHWELAAGRPPGTSEEIVLGTRLADELDKTTGDVVELRDAGGDRHSLAVVGGWA